MAVARSLNRALSHVYLRIIAPICAADFDGLVLAGRRRRARGRVRVRLVMLVTSRYKRCPSNRVLVIYGKVGGGNTAKCIHGGAAFVWPLIQDYAYLSLEPIQIEIPLTRRAVDGEHPRQRAERVHRRHRHRARR